jgi:hypothetical protein
MDKVEFYKYITNPLTKEEMTMLYRANNIQYENCCLYSDFIRTLNHLVVTTYLGDDIHSDKGDKENHYKWCFNKVINDFKEEGILFTYNDDIEFYFYNYYLEQFYKDEEKKDAITKLDKLPKYSFDYRKIKTRSDLDLLVQLYKLFDISLKNKLKT